MNIMNFLFLSCKRTTELIEKRNVDDLSVIENLQLKVHVLMCRACKAYENQSEMIEKTLSQWSKSKDKVKKNKLSAGMKSQIIKEVKDI
jgi:hypothetical protein